MLLTMANNWAGHNFIFYYCAANGNAEERKKNSKEKIKEKKTHFKLAAECNKRKGFRLEGKAAASKRLEELKREAKTKPKVKAAQQLPASE